ncbi:MAG TPA: 7-cyano-7-deazaguanine synthase [Vicinamibacterales bacterium]|nr:7-cyano-7-deazaguanine synthase [Vicinamibacterales bacterium]
MQTAVLMSGGLDSAVLLADEAARGSGTIHPVYIRVGLAWEDGEQAAVRELLGQEPLRGRTRPLVSLTVDMRDVYASDHWAVGGRPPGYHTPDEDVYLPGRNVILLGKAAVFCAASQIDRLVLGTLGHNPFPDATDEFRRAMAVALSLGLAHTLTIDAPFASLAKSAVVERGALLGVPLHLTLSCMKPPQDSGESRGIRASRALHCGVCSKCRERHDAFLEAGVADPTSYLDRHYIEQS